MERSATRYLNFTKRGIESLPVPKQGRLAVYDEHTEGLGVRVETNGRRSFFWFKKVQGTPTFRSIGSVDDVSIEKARDTAKEWNGQLAEWKRHGYEGANPFEKPSGEPTFGELVEDYIARHIRPRAKQPERAERELRWAVDAHLSTWKIRKIGTIRRTDVLRVHAELGRDRKFAANRVVELVRGLFNFAHEAELWANDENPAAEIKPFDEPERTRFLQADELARLFTVLRKERNADLRDFVLLSLFCGARKSDTLAMRWENLALADNRWEVPNPKSRKPYVIALVPEAVEILKERQARSSDNPWVFPSPQSKTGRLVNLKRGWKRLLRQAQLSDLRIHDLRRTLGSWQAASGTSLQIIGKSLGHSTAQATQVYAQLDLDPVRRSVTAATQAMIAAASSTKNKSKRLKALPLAAGAV